MNRATRSVLLISLTVLMFALSPAFAVDYAAENLPRDIPDAYWEEGELEYGEANSGIPVLDSRTIVDINVTVDITHPRVSDLKVFLVGPMGPVQCEMAVLIDGMGGEGANLTATIFDDEASQAIADGTAPFTGSFRPIESLSVFDGMSTVDEIWTLQIQDKAMGHTGTLNSWTLSITYAGGGGGGPAPALSLNSPDPETLWPPTGARKSVTISGSVIDAGGGVGSAWLEVCDDYGECDDDCIPVTLDAEGNFSIPVELIAGRLQSDRDGRCYEISLCATNTAGDEAAPVSVVVMVPHDRRR